MIDFSTKAAVVPYGDDTFVLIGGHDKSGPSDSIYEFDERKRSWIERAEKLSTPRHRHLVLPLPDPYC